MLTRFIVFIKNTIRVSSKMKNWLWLLTLRITLEESDLDKQHVVEMIGFRQAFSPAHCVGAYTCARN